MKILMFGWEFPPFNSGGLGVACFGLTQALSNLGTEITFVLPKKIDARANFMKILFANNKKINLVEINSLLKAYQTSYSYINDFSNSNDKNYGSTLISEVERYASVATEIATSTNFDIIHAHDWLSTLAGIKSKEVSGKPLITHIHATEIDRGGGKGVNPQVFSIEKKAVDYSDKVIAVSNLTKDILRNFYDADNSKVEVVHNGLIKFEEKNQNNNLYDGLKQYKENGYSIVLFVGRITLSKGPDYFIKAAQKVLQYNPKTMFIIAGSGDMEKKIIMDVAKAGISDKVLFAGFVRGAELSGLYALADLFVMPSVSEPFGLTALEALSEKTPILISKQSGVGEVVSNALRCDFWDVDDMTDKILGVIQFKSLKNQLGNLGRNEALGCTWDKAAQKTIKIYENLLNQ